MDSNQATEPTPLPPLADCCLSKQGIFSEPVIAHAYGILYDLEAYASGLPDNPNSLLKDVRVLGHLMVSFGNLHQHFGVKPVARLAEEITSPRDDGGTPTTPERRHMSAPHASYIPRIRRLGLFYDENLLRAFKHHKGPIPTPSSHPTRGSFDTLEDMMEAYLEGKTTPDTTKQKSLARDGFRCVITGLYDAHSLKRNKALVRLAKQDDAGAIAINCCHILSQSTVQNVNDTDPKSVRRRTAAACVMSVLAALGLEDLVAQFSDADGIHSLKNVMTMCPHAHGAFDELSIWLEPTSVPNQYALMGDGFAIKALGRRQGDVVEFTVHGRARDNGPDLPDPRLICLHAICARVLHMSGAAEYLEEHYRADEEQPVLAADGSSAHILEDRIQRVLIAATVT